MAIGKVAQRDSGEFLGLDRAGWIAIGIGAAVAIAAMLIWPLGFVFSYVGILIHEIGHAFFAWMFGYPSIPAFDFAYGGGVTRWQERSMFVRVIVWAAMAAAVFAARHRRNTLITVLVLVGVFVALDLSRWRMTVIYGMGHGMELLIAAVFIYRALSGVAVKTPLERPLYAAIGVFLVLHNCKFALSLMTSASARQSYSEAKGGGDWMDFSMIRGFLGWEIQSIAFMFVIAAIAVIPLTFGIFLARERIFETLRATFELPPKKSRDARA